MIYNDSSIWDSDAYGVNTDPVESVSDWFTPTKNKRREAREYFDSALAEILEAIADMNGIPRDEYEEWDESEWDEFRECLDI